MVGIKKEGKANKKQKKGRTSGKNKKLISVNFQKVTKSKNKINKIKIIIIRKKNKKKKKTPGNNTQKVISNNLQKASKKHKDKKTPHILFLGGSDSVRKMPFLFVVYFCLCFHLQIDIYIYIYTYTYIFLTF